MTFTTTRLLTLSAAVSLAPASGAAPVSLRAQAWPVPSRFADYAALRVIDGDTIDVGKLGTARYIGVDTPETKHSRKPVERVGQEAYEANRKLVDGRKVKLEFDAEQHDRYGRPSRTCTPGPPSSTPGLSRPARPR
ncbi:MAG: thermonuclease family protein [Bacillota bacterium]